MPKYRLLVGQHIQNEVGTNIEVTYNAGDTFESTSLLERKNSPNHSPKFERLQDDAYVGPVRKKAPLVQPEPEPVPIEEDTVSDKLNYMSVKELQAVARENAIDLQGAKTKNAIIEVIRRSMEE